MRSLFFSALLLTTAVAAQDAPSVDIRPSGGDWTPPTCHLTPESREPTRNFALRQPTINVTTVRDVGQCPGDPEHREQCGDHCVVDIDGSLVNGRDPRDILKDALLRCNTTVRLGPDVELDFSDRLDLRPLVFGRCITLTSVNDFNRPTSPARTPRTLGPLLNYGPADPPDEAKIFLRIECPEGESPPTDHIRISGFRLFGPTQDQQYDADVGIRIRRCVDVEVSNMEIAGWGSRGIGVDNETEREDPPRITDFSQVRIHDNFIHHNQHPTRQGGAQGYGVELSNIGARAHIYRNVFDFNRHAIAADGKTGGYIAEENLVLRGGGWHDGPWHSFTHIFDVHGTDDECYKCWFPPILWPIPCGCLDGYGGQAGEEFRYHRNSFQYNSNNAIHIRGKPSIQADITENVFPHKVMGRCCGLGGQINDLIRGTAAILLYTDVPVNVSSDNIIKTNTFGEYYTQCDFDGDRIDDLFLAAGATWWFSSSGKFHWSFLNTSSTRIKDLKFGYFDDDDRCDVLTESGGSGRWVISSGGTGPWTPLEQVWRSEKPWNKEMWAPLKDVAFGRFDPNDLSATHAFHRDGTGAWWLKKLSAPTSNWEPIGGSSFPMPKLRFGDFTGDGVTDVLAVERGRWAISESARKPWRTHNHYVGDSVAGLFIANMDQGDDHKADDILRLEVREKRLPGGTRDVELIWWRSKDGADKWREFKKYLFRYPSGQEWDGIVYPNLGFVGRFGAVSGGTLVIDTKRIGHFFSPGNAEVEQPAEWPSLFPY
jgi:hypothetical protein